LLLVVPEIKPGSFSDPCSPRDPWTHWSVDKLNWSNTDMSASTAEPLRGIIPCQSGSPSSERGLEKALCSYSSCFNPPKTQLYSPW